MCNSGVSLKHSYANVPCETPIYKPAAEEELELVFREEEVFEGSFPARRRNWMEISTQLIIEPHVFIHCQEKMRTLLLTRISEGGGSCWDRQESETDCRGFFSMRHPVVLVSSCWLPSLSDLGFVRPQWWLNSPAQFKSLFPPGFVSVSQSCVPFFYRHSSYCHCTASAFRQLAHNLQQTVK